MFTNSKLPTKLCNGEGTPPGISKFLVLSWPFPNARNVPSPCAVCRLNEAKPYTTARIRKALFDQGQASPQIGPFNRESYQSTLVMPPDFNCVFYLFSSCYNTYLKHFFLRKFIVLFEPSLSDTSRSEGLTGLADCKNLHSLGPDVHAEGDKLEGATLRLSRPPPGLPQSLRVSEGWERPYNQVDLTT